MRKDERIPLTEKQKCERRTVTILLALLWLVMTSVIMAEVLAVVRLLTWLEVGGN